MFEPCLGRRCHWAGSTRGRPEAVTEPRGRRRRPAWPCPSAPASRAPSSAGRSCSSSRQRALGQEQGHAELAGGILHARGDVHGIADDAELLEAAAADRPDQHQPGVDADADPAALPEMRVDRRRASPQPRPARDRHDRASGSGAPKTPSRPSPSSLLTLPAVLADDRDRRPRRTRSGSATASRAVERSAKVVKPRMSTNSDRRHRPLRLGAAAHSDGPPLPQPERHVRRLHRLGDDAAKLGARGPSRSTSSRRRAEKDSSVARAS